MCDPVGVAAAHAMAVQRRRLQHTHFGANSRCGAPSWPGVRVGHTARCSAVAEAVQASLARLKHVVRSARATIAAEAPRTVGRHVGVAALRRADDLTGAAVDSLAIALAWPCTARASVGPAAAGSNVCLIRAIADAAAAVDDVTQSLATMTEAEVSAAQQEVLNSVGIIFTTLASSGSAMVRMSAKVDLLVVDEAAQVRSILRNNLCVPYAPLWALVGVSAEVVLLG